MKARLVARGIPEHKILVAENWADGCEIRPAPFKDGPLVVHYSGTFGFAHEEDTIVAVMRQLREDSRFRFVFAGGGARREALEEFCRAEGIGTAEFRPYATRSELGPSLADGHVGLVTQMPGDSRGSRAEQDLRNHGGGTAGAVHRPPWFDTRAHPRSHMDAGGESSRETRRVWSFFSNGWNRIEVWCERLELGLGAPLRNTTTDRSEWRGFYRSLVFRTPRFRSRYR